ncbi:jg24940 [Pararge aegeria aegeria]|uniref:Jg24940 protein n=2 Tax=Pararge aegeria TaxID=116150 RepID=A0A8S4SK38_9NEOP|nr:jg24940 [Pararge aegeria aegeria]
MKTQTVYILLACLGLASVVTSQTNTYCGRRLATTLDYLCEGHLIKRSEPQLNSLQPVWPLMDAQKALEMRFRGKRQVVAECCDKPCTIDELMTYCGI